jgi:DNA-binding transcriptional MerR regulator
MARVWTVGEIARDAGLPLHKIEYWIRARNIQPTGRVGRLRVFDAETVQTIIAQLRGTPAKGDAV